MHAFLAALGIPLPTYSAREVSAHLGGAISERTLQRWAQERRVRHYRFGNRVRFELEDVRAYMTASTKQIDPRP